MAIQPDGQISPLADRAYAGLARISYQCNRLEDAAKYIQECIELSRRWENFEFLATAIVMSAELERVHNNPERVREAMRAAEQLVREHPLAPYTSMRIKSSLARLWIAQGNPERASELVQQCNIKMSNIPADGEIPYLQEPAYLSLLRLQLARGETDAALALSERLLNKLEGANRVGRLIETLVLQALAYQGMKDTHQAVAILEKAFALGQAEGYTRVFLDEGEPMAKLLYQARSHKTPAGYAAELLSAMGNASGSGGLPAKLLIDPLTLRELEVLRLIEAGYSNQEIAAKFVISVPTVKRHISNIYTKLGVSSRTQAVARGKELNLFQ
jgi:LuxR family maltose regulon positive regulatory protein